MKRIKTFKLWLLAVIGFLPVASALAEQTVEVSNFEELQDALEADNNGQGGRDVTIVLTANIDLTEDINAGHNGNVGRTYTFDFGEYTVDPGDYSIKLPEGAQVRVTDPSFFSLFTVASSDTRVKLCYKLDEDGYYVAEALVPVVQVTGKEQYFASLEDAFTYTTGSIELTLLKNVNDAGTFTASVRGTKDIPGKVSLTQNNCSIGGSTKIYFMPYTEVVTDKSIFTVIGAASPYAWMGSQETTGSYTYMFYPNEAMVGDIPYTTFSAAVSEANGATITLLTDVASPYYICDKDQVIVVDETDEHFVYSVDVCDDLADYGMIISAVGELGSTITTWSAEQGSVATIYYDEDNFHDYTSFGAALSAYQDGQVIILLANIGNYALTADDPSDFMVQLNGKELYVYAEEYGYHVTDETTDGTTHFAKVPYVAYIDFGEGEAEFYETFGEAVTAANGELVIELLQDVGDYTMAVDATLKVKLNGKELNVSVEGPYVVVPVDDEEEEDVTVYSVYPAVASITDDDSETTYYVTFGGALADYTDGDVIVMLGEDSYTLSSDDPTTFDVMLDGNTLTLYPDEYGYYLAESLNQETGVTTFTRTQCEASITRLVDVSDPDVPEPEMETQTTCYPTFAEAVADAGDEDVIDLLKNIPDTYVMATSATIRVRKGDFSLTVVAADPSYWVDDSETEESADGLITIYQAALCEASITKVVDNEPVTTYYPTFALAAAAAGEGDVIDLLANVEEYTMPSVAGTTIKVRMGDYSIEYMDVDGAYVITVNADEDDSTVTVFTVVDAVASIDFYDKTDNPEDVPETYTVYYATFAEAVNVARDVMVIDLLQDAEYTMTSDETIKVRLGVNNLDISVSGAYVLTYTTDADDETVTVYTAEAAIASITTGEGDEAETTYYVTFVDAANAAGENDVIDLLAQPNETDYFCLTTDGKTTLSVRKHDFTPYMYSSSDNMLLVETKIEDAENGDITVYSLVAPVAYVDFYEGTQYFATFAEAVEAAAGVYIIGLLTNITDAYSMEPGTTIKVYYDGYSLEVVVAGPYCLKEEIESGIITYTTVAAVASVTKDGTTTYYTDFDEAVAAASNGRFVVELWMDVEQESPYELYVGETLKVKKNGHSFYVEDEYDGDYFYDEDTDAEGVTTYTLMELTEAKLTVKPRAKENLTYTALKHNLIIPGVVKGGWLEYSLSENTGYSQTIPAKTEAGTYYVYYRVVPDEQHYSYDYDNEPIEVVIHKATVTPTVSLEGWTYGDEPNEPVVEGLVKDGSVLNVVTFTYASKGSDEFSEDVPEEAGEYVVKASVEQTPNYIYNDCTAEFSITMGDLVLADDADNSEVLASAEADAPYNVVLQGRTLYKDATWNTLCLPFDLSAEQIAAGPLAGATIMTLDVEAKEDDAYLTRLENSTLYMHFADATTITAGVPCIVKWAEGENVTDPTFAGVVVSSTAATSVTSNDGNVVFKGLFAPEGIYSAANNNLYLADDNNLYWPTAEDFTVNAFRAYFQVNTSSEAPVRRSILSFGNGTTHVNSLSVSAEENWYDLSGRQLNAKPAERGIYIVNGKKVVIK